MLDLNMLGLPVSPHASHGSTALWWQTDARPSVVHPACSSPLTAALRPRTRILTQPRSPGRLLCMEPACWSCLPG